MAIVVFPGTNCEHDVSHVIESLGAQPELVWHRETDLGDFDGVVLPGGFAHGDYLRPGAIARFSPVMSSVIRHAGAGKPVLGICNGFQILCEAGLLPGALIANTNLRFLCRQIHVRVTSTDSILTSRAEVGQVLRLPLNSYEGNYQPSGGSESKVVLQYCDPQGRSTETSNPNGSHSNAAAIGAAAGNVVGVMPHPERASEKIIGSSDGLVLLESFVTSMAPALA